MEAASRLGGLMPCITEVNEFRPLDRNLASLSVKREPTSLKPRTHLKRRAENLHGRGWKDPMYSEFQNGSGWQNPICTLHQSKNQATCQVENPDAGESCTQATPFEESDVSSSSLDLKSGVIIDYAVREKKQRAAFKPLQVYSGPSSNCIFLNIMFL